VYRKPTFPRWGRVNACRLLQFMLTLLLSLSLLCGCFISVGQSSTICAYVFLSPSVCTAREIGQIFDVSVNISNVENLHSFELTITYNTSLLDVIQVVQGNFFPQEAAFNYERNESYGFVAVNMSLPESISSLSGNGTLVLLTFESVQAPEACTASILKLDQIRLYNPDLEPIDHMSISAIYFWRSIGPDPPVEGGALDLYTQKSGIGPNEPGGEFMTGEIVQLTSRVTYNNSTMQNMLVAFQVLNPLNETVLILLAVTDSSGLAMIHFRIPNLLSSNGTWTAVSTVEIAGNVVWDTLTFHVYFIPMPVGGYSLPVRGDAKEKSLALYMVLMPILTAIFTVIRLIKHGWRNRGSLLGFNSRIAKSEKH